MNSDDANFTPEGLTPIILSRIINFSAYGQFRHGIFKDTAGNCYLHVSANPKFSSGYVDHVGSMAKAREIFFPLFLKRLNVSTEEEPYRSDFEAGTFTYRIRKFDGMLVATTDRSNIPMDIEFFFKRFEKDTSDMLNNKAEFSINQMVNQALEPTDLITALDQAGKMHDGASLNCRSYGIILTHHADHREAMLKILAKGGVTKFRYLSQGGTGICLEGITSSGKSIAVMISQVDNEHWSSDFDFRASPLVRWPLPHQMQELATYSSTYLRMSATVMLDTDNVTKSHLAAVLQGIESYADHNQQRYEADDRHIYNIGLSPAGIPYCFDGNSVVKARDALKPPLDDHSLWVNPDGTWKQYTEFEKLHRDFNSSLHRAGGKFSTPEKVGAVSGFAAANGQAASPAA